MKKTKKEKLTQGSTTSVRDRLLPKAAFLIAEAVKQVIKKTGPAAQLSKNEGRGVPKTASCWGRRVSRSTVSGERKKMEAAGEKCCRGLATRHGGIKTTLTNEGSLSTTYRLTLLRKTFKTKRARREKN